MTAVVSKNTFSRLGSVSGSHRYQYWTIAGDAFNQALTKVWLGEKLVQPDLKKSLIGA